MTTQNVINFANHYFTLKSPRALTIIEGCLARPCPSLGRTCLSTEQPGVMFNQSKALVLAIMEPAQYDRVISWLASDQGDTNPPTSPSALLKRKCDMSPPHSSGVLKRRRIEDADDIKPEQSASQLGRESLFTLDAITTLNPLPSRVSATARRPPSPFRETAMSLRKAWPPIVTEDLEGTRETLPTYVERLGDHLAEGIDSGFIPKGLQVSTLTSSFSYQILTYPGHHQERPGNRPSDHQND